jgi:hypothetical protein
MAVATALALPGAAMAQTAKETELEARIAELEKLVSEMKTDKASVPVVVEKEAPPAPTVQTANKGSLTIKGFVIASLFTQDANFTFGNGQNAQFPSAEFDTDEWTWGGDVRNTRITLDWQGPAVGDMKFNGLVEADFFGGFNGTGAFSDEQPVPRLRLAYADMNFGKSTVRVGQFWSPMFGNVPASPTHVAFPLGYGSAGMVGWRFPGVAYYYNFGGDGIKTKLSLAAMRGSWSGPGGNLDNNGAGEAGMPQLEARLDFSGKNWNIYVVGHWDEKDLSGPGASAPKDSLSGEALEVGAKVTMGVFTLQGNAYSGSAIGQQFGHITQFGDISGWGGWLQGSVKVGKNWSLNAFYGLDDPKDKDVMATIANPALGRDDDGDFLPTPVSTSPLAGRVKNEQIALSAMYSSGPYVFGIEWLNASLDGRGKTTSLVDGAPVTVVNSASNREGNQLSFSAWYKF